MPEPLPFEISVADALKLRTAAPVGLRVLDVRDPDEFEICHLAGAELMPLVTVPHGAIARLGDPDARLLVYCHHGVRSLRAVEILRQLGYANSQSLTGGIDQWSVEIDPAIPRY